MKDKINIAVPESEKPFDLEDVELPPFSMSRRKLLVLEACQETKDKQEMADLSEFSRSHISKNIIPKFTNHKLIRKTPEGFKTTRKGFKVKRKIMHYRNYELTFVEEKKNKHYEDYVGGD